MSNWFETINTALFHSVRTPFFVLVAVFAVIATAIILFAVRELKHDLS